MNRSLSSRTATLELGPRADSPMRDETSILNKSPVHGRVHGLPTPVNDAPATGFTAVNTSFRPDDSASRPTLPPVEPPSSLQPRHQPHGRLSLQTTGNVPPTHQQAPTPLPPPANSYHSHAWRPEEPRPTTEREPSLVNGSEDTSKRKRGSSPNDEYHRDGRRDQSDGNSRVSPKRRMTSLDGTARSPDRNHDGERHRDGDTLESATNDARELSPVYRNDRRTPPPPPRPAVEAQLAQSLQQQFGDTQATLVDNNSPPDEDDDDDDQQQQGFSSQNADGSDPKKNRKRNFSNRTKTGCHTCRARKKKCDEGKPTCNNCLRGNFTCGGYGPKPPGGTKITSGRPVVPLQAKLYEQQPPGPTQFFENPPYHDPHSRQLPPYHDRFHLPRPDAHEQPSHYGPARPVPPIESRPPMTRENYPPPRWPGQPEHPPHSILHERLPPADFTGIPHPATFPRHHSAAPPPPPPGQWHPQPPPPAMYRPATAVAPTVISSHHSEASSGSGGSLRRGAVPPTFGFPPGVHEDIRFKMNTCQRHRHYEDQWLNADRASCKRAIEARNDAWKGTSTTPQPDRERCFQLIVDPTQRPFLSGPWAGPVGKVGSHVNVQPNFDCEFGYNIHLGDKVFIGDNCHMQDANTIYVGDRAIIGPNVKFYCLTASLDPNQRQGSLGEFIAGPIVVEEDAMIGGDSIIMPFRTIGKGAVVGAGSVVTRDVKPYTVVAGNPAKPIRRGTIDKNRGSHTDKHVDDIQEQNDEMMKKAERREVIPVKPSQQRHSPPPSNGARKTGGHYQISLDNVETLGMGRG